VKDKTKQFIGGFVITTICIGTLCGFAVVDLSADRYMPGRFAPMFAVTAIESQGVDFSFMGKQYSLYAEPANRIAEVLYPYQGLLPLHLQAGFTAGGMLHIELEAALEE